MRNQVLYVEDNPVNSILMSKLVARISGLETIVAESYSKAIVASQENKDNIGLVLCDLNLEDGYTGTDVMSKLKEFLPSDIKYVVITADTNEDLRNQLLESGFDAYLTKPFDFVVLTKYIQDSFFH